MQVRENEKNSWGASNYEKLSAAMAGRRRFFISDGLKRLEKLSICKREVTQFSLINSILLRSLV